MTGETSRGVVVTSLYPRGRDTDVTPTAGSPAATGDRTVSPRFVNHTGEVRRTTGRTEDQPSTTDEGEAAHERAVPPPATGWRDTDVTPPGPGGDTGAPLVGDAVFVLMGDLGVVAGIVFGRSFNDPNGWALRVSDTGTCEMWEWAGCFADHEATLVSDPGRVGEVRRDAAERSRRATERLADERDLLRRQIHGYRDAQKDAAAAESRMRMGVELALDELRSPDRPPAKAIADAAATLANALEGRTLAAARANVPAAFVTADDARVRAAGARGPLRPGVTL